MRVLSSILIDLITKLPQNIFVIATCKTFENLHMIIQQSKIFEKRINLLLPNRKERQIVMIFLIEFLILIDF